MLAPLITTQCKPDTPYSMQEGHTTLRLQPKSGDCLEDIPLAFTCKNNIADRAIHIPLLTVMGVGEFTKTSPDTLPSSKFLNVVSSCLKIGAAMISIGKHEK